MKSNLIGCLAFSSVVLALVLVCYVNTTPGSSAREIVTAFIKGDNPQGSDLTTETSLKTAASKGNLLLRFAGFDAENPNPRVDFPAFIYYRYSYTLFPVRVFVGDRTTIINNGTDIIKSNFDPGKEWLDSNNVRSVVKIEYVPGKGIRSTLERR
jgi:hypothetical protein